MTPFAYEPLGPEADTIRLIKVNRGEEYISCSLELARLRDVQDDFIVVSHVWGEDEPTLKLLLSDQPFFVTPQLWQFLNLAAERLPGKRLWIDSLCIDQGKVAEKERQIALMSRIYSSAQKFVAFLYSPVDEKLDSRSSTARTIADSNSNVFEDLITDHARRDLSRLLFHQYWSRVWIIQEVRFSKRREFWWEGQILSSKRLERIATDAHIRFGRDRKEHMVLNQALWSKLYSDNWEDRSGYTKSSLLDHTLVIKSGVRAFIDADEKYNLSEMVIKFRNFGCSKVFDRVFALLGLAKGGNRVAVRYDIPPFILLSQIWNISRKMSTDQCWAIGQVLGIDFDGLIIIPREYFLQRLELEDVLHSLRKIAPGHIVKQITDLQDPKAWKVMSRSRVVLGRLVDMFVGETKIDQHKIARQGVRGDMHYDSYQDLVLLIRRLRLIHTAARAFFHLPNLGMYYILSGLNTYTGWLEEVLRVVRVSSSEGQFIQINHVRVTANSRVYDNIKRGIEMFNIEDSYISYTIPRHGRGFFFAQHYPSLEGRECRGLNEGTFLALMQMASPSHPVWERGFRMGAQRWILPVT